jgi:DNA-binding MarR family transcriptional regulator
VPTLAAGKRRRSARFDSLEQEAYLSLWRTYDRLKQVEDDLFAQYELTAQQYNTLRLLRRAHPERIPTLAIASRLVSKAPDITRLLDRLAERNLVDRERPQGDRRTVCIGITPEGMALLNRLAEEVRECHERQVGHLTPEELETLIDLLRRARSPHEPPESSWK